MELHELRDLVIDEKSLVVFLKALVEDFDDEKRKESLAPSSPYGPGANGWENRDLSSFLWAAITWAETSENGLRFYEKSDNPWKRVADILYAAKIYE